MIGKTNSGSGGGGGVAGLKVVAYPTSSGFPEKAKNKVIAVLTDSEIVDYIIAPTEPSHLAGRVWVKVGMTGIDISLDRHDTFKVKLIQVVQSDGSTWSAKPAKVGIKKDGVVEWSDTIDIVVYDKGMYGVRDRMWYGDTASGKGNGTDAKGPGGTVTFGFPCLWYMTKNNTSGKIFVCAGPLDVTNMTKINALMYNYGDWTTANTGMYLARHTNAGSGSAIKEGGITYSNLKNLELRTPTVYTLDVSKLTGEVYIYVGTDVSSWSANRYIRIERIWSV